MQKHLEYMLLELFKNAVRATIEHHLRSEGLVVLLKLKQATRGWLCYMYEIKQG